MAEEKHGFTIVELLIVIVVIAILAAISIVAYANVQSRAHDAIIRSDFSTISKLFEMYKVEQGVYPSNPNGNPTGVCTSGGADGTVIRSNLASLNMKLSTGSYNTSTANTNLLYVASNDGQHYALLGYATGNPTYYITDSIKSAQVYVPNETLESRYPGGNPCGIADNLGVSSPLTNGDFGYYYVYVRTGGGFRIWQ